MSLELICANCQQPFHCHPSEAKKGRKYCSVVCRSAHLHKKHPSLASRTPVEFTCQECSKPFTMMQSYVTAYRKKYQRDPLYCSLICSCNGRRKSADKRNQFTCEFCGKVEVRSRNTNAFRIYRGQKFCSNECKSMSQEVSAYNRFKAGITRRHTKRHGYQWVSVPALANNGKKAAILEHRHVMQQRLGRTLFTHETVHHRDGDRTNNAIENLELFSSRHGPGQRVVDKVDFAIEMMRLYPEFFRARGVDVPDVTHVITDPEPLPDPH